MPLISDQYKYIFIHTPKTAGSSIKHTLPNGRKIGDTHEHARIIKQWHPDKWDVYFTFAFMRNPWDRLFSMYKFRMKKMKRSESFQEWFQKDLMYTEIERKQTPKDDPLIPNLMKPQVNWLKDKNGEIIVDFIGQFEYLERDWFYVCDQLELQRTPLPHIQKTSPSNYKDYFTPYMRDFVAEHFKPDIEMFGYEF